MGTARRGIMADTYTVRTRKFMTNRLLMRKQMVLDVLHPGAPMPSKETIKEKVAGMFNVNDSLCVSVFGFRTSFGGGKSTGFCLIYDNSAAFKKFEPKYRQVRNGVELRRRRPASSARSGRTATRSSAAPATRRPPASVDKPPAPRALLS